jgi:succinoglycan biosynthesis transport protein ExoP
LIEAQETAFTRPEVQQGDVVPSIDDRAVTSQVQVMRSRDVAEQVIDQLGLRDDPRFDSALARHVTGPVGHGSSRAFR